MGNNSNWGEKTSTEQWVIHSLKFKLDSELKEIPEATKQYSMNYQMG